jgi:integrase
MGSCCSGRAARTRRHLDECPHACWAGFGPVRRGRDDASGVGVVEDVLEAFQAGLQRSGLAVSTRNQWLIIAAIETGCRRGELLARQWTDVHLDRRVILVRAVEDGARKTGRARAVSAVRVCLRRTRPSRQETSSARGRRRCSRRTATSPPGRAMRCRGIRERTSPHRPAFSRPPT